MLADWRRSLATDRNAVKKYDIVRQVLTRLNEQGDGGLGPLLPRPLPAQHPHLCRLALEDDGQGRAEGVGLGQDQGERRQFVDLGPCPEAAEGLPAGNPRGQDRASAATPARSFRIDGGSV